MRRVSSAQARKHAAPSAVFQLAAARSKQRAGRRHEVPGDRGDAEEDAAEQVDRRLPPAGAAAYRQPPVPGVAARSPVGDRAGDEETDRAAPVRSPDELVVLGIRKGDVHRLVRGDVEEERAGGLDEGGPPRRAPASGEPPLGPGEPALQRSTGGEQDRADEEGDGIGRLADELRVARERTDQEAGRPQGEAESHPAFPSHEQPSRSAPRRLRR